MSGNTYGLEKALQQYTYDLLANNIKTEVEKQFDAWGGPGGFLDQFADAQADAVNQQVRVLKEAEEERRRSFERALFVLNLLAPVALSWVGAALQYRVGPKIFNEYKEGFGAAGYFISNIPKQGAWRIQVPSKVFGDVGKELASVFGSLVGKNLSPPGFKEINGDSVASSRDVFSFKTNLLMKVKDQKDQAIKAIMHIAENILTDVTFGQALLKRLYEEQPRIKLLADPRAVEEAGHKMINGILNQVRAQWAEKWFYYRCSPPRVLKWRTSEGFEKAMWMVWVQQQHFKYVQFPTGGMIYGESGNLEDAIVTRLFELQAPVTALKLGEKSGVWDPLGVNRSTGQSQEQVDKLLTWARNLDLRLLSGDLDGKPRTLYSVETIWGNP